MDGCKTPVSHCDGTSTTPELSSGERSRTLHVTYSQPPRPIERRVARVSCCYEPRDHVEFLAPGEVVPETPVRRLGQWRVVAL